MGSPAASVQSMQVGRAHGRRATGRWLVRRPAAQRRHVGDRRPVPPANERSAAKPVAVRAGNPDTWPVGLAGWVALSHELARPPPSAVAADGVAALQEAVADVRFRPRRASRCDAPDRSARRSRWGRSAQRAHVGIRQLPRVGNLVPAAAAQLHRAARIRSERPPFHLALPQLINRHHIRRHRRARATNRTEDPRRPRARPTQPLPTRRPWRVTVGRPYPGSYGIARSYEEAREGLTMAVRLHLDTPLVPAEQLLIYRVLLRDQPAITDLVHSVLGQLVHSRGEAEPPAGHPRRLLRHRRRHHRNRPPTTPVRPRGHLPPRSDQHPHRMRPHRPSPTVHHQHRRARRETPRLAQTRPDHRPLADRQLRRPLEYVRRSATSRASAGGPRRTRWTSRTPVHAVTGPEGDQPPVRRSGSRSTGLWRGRAGHGRRDGRARRAER